MIEKKSVDDLQWDRTMTLVERILIDQHVNQVFILDYKEVSYRLIITQVSMDGGIHMASSMTLGQYCNS